MTQQRLVIPVDPQTTCVAHNASQNGAIPCKEKQCGMISLLQQDCPETHCGLGDFYEISDEYFAQGCQPLETYFSNKLQ